MRAGEGREHWVTMVNLGVGPGTEAAQEEEARERPSKSGEKTGGDLQQNKYIPMAAIVRKHTLTYFYFIFGIFLSFFLDYNYTFHHKCQVRIKLMKH